MENYLFYSFGGLAVLTALLMVTRRNPVMSALSLVGCLFCLAALYVILGAHYVAAAQILVYAGAIMVLFLFVIMLLNLKDPTEHLPSRNVLQKCIGVAIALNLLVLVARKMASFGLVPESSYNEQTYGTTGAVAKVLFTTYLLPFELAGLLLLVAIVGAVVIAKREL